MHDFLEVQYSRSTGVSPPYPLSPSSFSTATQAPPWHKQSAFVGQLDGLFVTQSFLLEHSLTTSLATHSPSLQEQLILSGHMSGSILTQSARFEHVFEGAVLVIYPVVVVVSTWTHSPASQLHALFFGHMSGNIFTQSPSFLQTSS